MSYPVPPPVPPYGAPPPPPRGGSSVWIIVAVVVGVVVLTCGGLVGAGIYMVGAFTDAVESGFDEFNGPGSPSDPLTVEEGDAFTIDETSFEEGWALDLRGPTADGVVDLTATNDKPEERVANFVRVDVDLIVDGLTEATVRCRSDGLLEPGESETLSCATYDDLPRSVDRIEVSQPY